MSPALEADSLPASYVVGSYTAASTSYLFYMWYCIYICHYLFLKDTFWEFPGGPVVDFALSFQRVQVQSLVEELHGLRNHKLHGLTKKEKEGRKEDTYYKIHKFPNKLYHDMYYFKYKLNSKNF